MRQDHERRPLLTPAARHALGIPELSRDARGLVTPRGDNKLILFITEGEGQQPTVQRYSNHFDGHMLNCDGPDDHFAEDRILNARLSADEIHLFHREDPRADFTYHGRVRLVDHHRYTDRPSRFTFAVE